MDNLTHTLTGLMLARCGLDRGTKGAAAAIMLAANAPDIDVVSWFPGSLTYLEYHRGYAHSLLLAPLVALIPLAIVKVASRAPWSLWLYFSSLLAVFSHLLLDFTNIYGIRLFLPFSARWLRLDITDVIDPWIWLIFLLAVAAPLLAGLVGSEIASRKTQLPKRGWAWFAVLAILAYDSARFVAHQRALAMLNSHTYQGVIPTRVSAMPARFNPLLWRGVIEGKSSEDDFVYEVAVNVAQDFDPGAGRLEFPAKASPAMEAARRTPAFEAFARFNQLPFWRVTNEPDGQRVDLIDLRFGSPSRPGFIATGLVDAGGRMQDARFAFGLPR